MSLFDHPIRDHDGGDRTRVVWSRQCALCDHACLEREWLCDCCQQLDRDEHRACLGRIEGNQVRPLLPPHWPPHARRYADAHHRVTVKLEEVIGA